MTNVLEIDKKNMFDIKSAASATGYSRDYITRLAREGKIVATQVGRQWYLDLDSLKRYAEVSALEQKVRQQHLSEQRREEREMADKLAGRKQKREQIAVAHERRAGAVLTSLVVAGLLTAFAANTFLMQMVLPAKSQYANVYLGSEVSAGETVLFGDTEHTEVFSDGSIEVTEFAAVDTGVLLLPQEQVNGEVLPAAEMFSDNVILRRDEYGQTYIAPADKEGNQIGPETKFVLVPVNQNKMP